MSVKVMAAVWETDLPATDRIVLLALADHADDEGTCYPSVARLGARTGLSARGVQGALKRLVEAGYLAIEYNAGKRGSNRFTISANPRTTCTPAPDAPPHDVHPNPRTTCTTPPARRAPEPSVEPSGNRQSKGAREILVAWASPEPVDSFIAYRRRHKKGGPLTETAAKRLAASLREIFDAGGDTDDALGMAEERGWLVIKPDWYFNAKGNGHAKSSGTPNGDATLRAIAAAAGAF